MQKVLTRQLSDSRLEVRTLSRLPKYATVVESADTPDLKSGVGNGVRVQVPPVAPFTLLKGLIPMNTPFI